MSRFKHHLAALVFSTVCGVPAIASDPNVLWRIVHDQCVPHEQQFHTPLPCTAITDSGRSAILKDIEGATQFLLIPTARVTGIEDPAILVPGAPNYWHSAWQARNLVQALAKRALADDALSLAINSVDGRSQNQLHIHIDCIRADIREALRQHVNDIGGTWALFPVPLAGHEYRAMRVETLDRPGADPFRLLADQLPAARTAMGLQSIAAVGAIFGDGEPGLVLLQTQADPKSGNRGEAEELQDHSCALARSP